MHPEKFKSFHRSIREERICMKMLIYNDSIIFGGHEIMTVELAKYLSLLNVSLVFVVNEKNSRLIKLINERLEHNVDIIETKFNSEKFPTLKLPFEILKIYRLMSIMKDQSPDAIIVSQGSIELGLKGILSGMLIRAKVFSYLPYTEKISATGGKFAVVRDFINSYIYRLIPNFILINEVFQKDLENNYNIKRDNVFVVENLVDFKGLTKPALLKKDSVQIQATLIGRFYLAQKGQDVAIKAIEILRKKNINIKLLLVGEGPDKVKIENTIAKSDAKDVIEIQSWSNNVKDIYDNSDLVLLPSRYEGIPLVLLESIYLKKKIVASSLSIFKHYLNSNCIFTTDSYEELADKIEMLISCDNESFYRKKPLPSLEKNMLVCRKIIHKVEG